MKKFAFCLALCMAMFFANAQAWTQYTVANSPLPNNQVQAVICKKNGEKWVGTANGLARFDGRFWQVYDESNSGLPSSSIRALATDGQNNVWIGTDKGLAKYNGQAWTVFNTQNSGLSRNTISQLYFDLPSNILWVATEIGLARFDGTHWTNMVPGNPWLDDQPIQSIIVDRKGILWVGSFDHFQFQGRLSRYDGVGWTRMKLEEHNLSSSFPSTLAIDEQNVLWMGTKGTVGGKLVRVEGDKLIAHDALPVSFNAAITCIVTQKSKMYLATATGLIVVTDTVAGHYLQWVVGFYGSRPAA